MGREVADPVDYRHPYPSMAQYAELLALRFDAKQTRQAYYRAMLVLHEHFRGQSIFRCEVRIEVERTLRFRNNQTMTACQEVGNLPNQSEASCDLASQVSEEQ